MRVGTVGAVVGCVLQQTHRVDVLDVVEGVGGKVQELVDGHFADQLIPAGIVEVSALQVVQGQGAGGVAEHDVRGVLIGLDVDEVVGQQGGQTALGLQAGNGGGEGAVPVAAGQISSGAGDEGVDVHGVVAVAHCVGDLHAGLAHREGVGIHSAVPGPLVGLGSIAVGGHAVGSGLALSSQDVVQSIMGVRADGEVVVARVHDEGLGVLAVVAGQQAHVHIHGNGLALAGLQGVGLFVVHQLQGGLFDAVLLVVVGVGCAGVQLHDSLAGHIAGVGGGHGHGSGALVTGDNHAVQGLLKGGVAHAVAEGIDHLVVVAPGAIAGGHGAIGVGVGAGRGIGTAVAQHDVRITGLVVTVAGVDALGLDQVGVDAGALSKVRSVCPGDVAKVLHGGSQCTVLDEGIAQMGRGSHGAVQHVGHAVEAISTGVAHPQDGVNVGVLFQVGDLHGVGCVDQHDDLVEIGLCFLDHGHFFIAQAQDVAVDGVHAVCQAFLAGVVCTGFAADTAHHHDGSVAVLGVLGLKVGVELLELVQGQLVRIIVSGDLGVSRQDAAAELGLGPFLVRKECLVSCQGLRVQLEAALGKGVKDLHGGLAVRHAAAAVAVNRSIAADAQHGDLGILGQRQGTVLVLQQGKGLLRSLDGEVLEALVGFFGRGEFRLVGPGIGFIVRLLCHSLGAAGAQEGIHRGAVELQDVACHHGNGQKQGKHHGQTAPQVFLLQHFVLL